MTTTNYPSPEERAELLRLDKKATPGPLYTNGFAIWKGQPKQPEDMYQFSEKGGVITGGGCGCCDGGWRDWIGELVPLLCEARNLAPRLCQQVDALEKELAQVKAERVTDEETRRWRDRCSQILGGENPAHGQIGISQVRGLYEYATGTPWTPQQPERVTDMELSLAGQYFDKAETGSPLVAKHLIEAERERRKGAGK